MALFSKTGSNGRALLLHDRALVGDGLGGPHIADELFYCGTISSARCSPLHRAVVACSIGVRTGAHIAASNSLTFVLILLLHLSGTASHVTSPAHFITTQASRIGTRGRRKAMSDACYRGLWSDVHPTVWLGFSPADTNAKTID